jgi:phospholipase C
MSTDRRAFLQALCSGAAAAALPASITRALGIAAHSRTGTIDDVDHIVILMQENRSFDQYYGALRGVRGFGDPRAVVLPSGKPVWNQPHGEGHVLPFRPGADNLGLQFLEDLPHDWTTTHAAWNAGKHDRWVEQKGPTTMAHLTRSDIPFYYALADAFTVCDAYHCSLLGCTDPNRLHMWTGWVGNDGRGGGPVVDNEQAGYDWPTYPEALQKSGVSWKIYQDIGNGLDSSGKWGDTDDAYVGNYGDNALLYFHQYQNARPGDPLYEKARTGTHISAGGSLFDVLQKDVQAGDLPQVSWIVAPEAYSEHPNWPPNYGAWYVSKILDTLTSNPEVWSRTVFFLMYDENDGFFDHMIPPTPPHSRAQGLSTVDTVNEFYRGNAQYPGAPYGLGVRVPMLVISPWSKGGWVNSEVFDHTSLIRFIERRFARQYPGIRNDNITPWRRAVAGDLTSAFNFSNPNGASAPLPSTAAYVPPDSGRHPDHVPNLPTEQALPEQEPGIRPARGVPYELHADGKADFDAGTITIQFVNSGKAAAVFHVRSLDPERGPWTYTVGPHARIADTWTFSDRGAGYDLSVYGPNGFFRAFKGSLSERGEARLDCKLKYDVDGYGVGLEITNAGHESAGVHISDAYTGKVIERTLEPGGVSKEFWRLDDSFGWYDLTLAVNADSGFLRHFAGHLEAGKDSMSDPAIGKRRPV